jgi:hypothetical protein
MSVTFVPVYDDAGIEEAIAAEAHQPAGGVIDFPDSFDVAHRDVISTAATRHGLPAIGTPDFPRVGGLMSYSFVKASGAWIDDRTRRLQFRASFRKAVPQQRWRGSKSISAPG